MVYTLQSLKPSHHISFFFVLHFLMLIKVKHIFVSSLKSNLKLLSSSVYCLPELPSRKFHETAERMNNETVKYPK